MTDKEPIKWDDETKWAYAGEPKEQIIIHDVDVSKCFIYNSHHTRTMCCSGLYCKQNEFANCHFKLYARKTQECEQKDKELSSNEKIINKLMKKVDELKKERKELKNELDLYKTWYRAKHDDVKNLLGCYRKSLEEIEGYFKKQDTSKTSLFNIFAIEQEILDIINKAKREGK